MHALQVFPEDQPGIYINTLQLGPLRADLSANYEYSGSNKINVSFIDIAAFLGPLQLIRKVRPLIMLCIICSGNFSAQYGSRCFEVNSQMWNFRISMHDACMQGEAANTLSVRSGELIIDISSVAGGQDFGGRAGYWKLTYHDDDLRILYTNQGNVFVLQREQ